MAFDTAEYDQKMRNIENARVDLNAFATLELFMVDDLLLMVEPLLNLSCYERLIEELSHERTLDGDTYPPHIGAMRKSLLRTLTAYLAPSKDDWDSFKRLYENISQRVAGSLDASKTIDRLPRMTNKTVPTLGEVKAFHTLMVSRRNEATKEAELQSSSYKEYYKGVALVYSEVIKLLENEVFSKLK